MIRTVIAGEVTPNFERNMVKHYRTGSDLPQRPQRCKFFADGQIKELGRRKDGDVRFFVSVDIGLQLKKI